MIIRPKTQNTLSLQMLPYGIFALTLITAVGLILLSPAQGSTTRIDPNAHHPSTIPKALIDPSVEYSGQAGTLYKSIQEMAIQLFQNLEDPDPVVGELANGIAVTAFVDLKKLTRTSSFGRYLAEQLMTEFQHQGFSVLEVRKSTSILVQEKHGEYGLSRNLNEIPPAVAAQTLITGTYTVAGDHVLVNAKIIDNKTTQLLSSATMLFPKNNLVELLLADSASASVKPKEITYMKRLEL
jgi:TolB-like protein